MTILGSPVKSNCLFNPTVMKKLSIAFLITAICTLAGTVHAQGLKFGPRFGIASSSVEVEDFIASSPNNLESLKISLQEASPEYQLGVFGRVSLLGLYVQPEVLLTTSSVRYLYEDITNASTETLKEQYFRLEMPLMAGIKLGPFRANAGPVYRMNLGTASELRDIQGLTRRFDESSVGLQAGVGLDLGKKVVLDLRYEGTLGDSQDDITLFGQTHALSSQKGQVVASMGISF